MIKRYSDSYEKLIKNVPEHFREAMKDPVYQDHRIFNCKTCGKMIWFGAVAPLLLPEIGKESYEVEYAMLRHFMDCPEMEMDIPIGHGVEVPFSIHWQNALRASAHKKELTLEEALEFRKEHLETKIASYGTSNEKAS